MNRREFLKRAALGGAGLAAAGAAADSPVSARGGLPPGSCGDPENVWFGRNVFPLPHTLEDGPSCALAGGKVVQPARELPVFSETDVLVVGGGPAGFAAAVASARAGVRTTLVERYGSLGGLFTNGMVLIVLCTSECADGKWRLRTRGLVEEFAERARALGADACSGKGPAATHHWQPTVDPEAAKYLMDRMVAEAGVDLVLHAWCADVIQDGDKVLGAVFESKQGRRAILAKRIVDCSGDADMLFAAGGDYRQITHGIGHVVRLGNLDRVTAKTVPTDADGRRLPSPWPTRSNEPNRTTWWGNSGTGPKGNGLDVRELTAAETAFRKEWWERVRAMRGTPGWERVFLAATCSQIGPRATRLIDAETVVDRAFLKAGVRVTDPIGWTGDDGPHRAFAIPYGQILPKGVENLLCAGRCLGAGDTIDTFRLIAPCFVTGQAAGAAAAASVRAGVAPRALDRALLRRELERQRVHLG